MTLTLGSLFTGFGGLDMAIEASEVAAEEPPDYDSDLFGERP